MGFARHWLLPATPLMFCVLCAIVVRMWYLRAQRKEAEREADRLERMKTYDYAQRRFKDR